MDIYTLVELRVNTPFYDDVLRGELPPKLQHLNEEDKNTVLALARLIFEEGKLQGQKSSNSELPKFSF